MASGPMHNEEVKFSIVIAGTPAVRSPGHRTFMTVVSDCRIITAFPFPDSFNVFI